MPFRIDPYFVSGNYTDFLVWLREIREDLLSRNKWNPQNTSGVVDIDQVRNFLQTKAISEAYEQLGKFDMKRYKVVLSARHKESEEISGVVKQYNTEEKKKSDNAIENTRKDGSSSFGIKKSELDFFLSQPEANEKIIEQNAAREKAIQDDLAKRDNTQSANNPVPEGERNDSTTNNQFGYAQAIDDTAFIQPQVGRPYENTTTGITENLINLDVQDVFTGYKQNSTEKHERIFKSWVKKKSDTVYENDDSKTFYKNRPYSEYARQVLKDLDTPQAPGSYKFFIEKLHGRYGDDTPYKMNKVKSQKGRVAENNGEQNLTNRMVFAAYIENYHDEFSVDWQSYNFLGRAEAVPAYKSTKRSMTLQFTILSDYSMEQMLAMEEFHKQIGKLPPDKHDELLEILLNKQNVDYGLGQHKPPTAFVNDGKGGAKLIGAHVPGMYTDTPEGLWNKMTFLAQCCYPYYRADGKMKDQPIIRVRIADFYDVVMNVTGYQNEMTAFGDGVQIDMNKSSLGNIPFGIKVTLTGTIIHNYEPASDFGGFYHRKEFDEGTLQPNGLTEEDIQKTLKDHVSRKSPISFLDTFINEKGIDLNKVDMKKLMGLEQNLNMFKETFGELKSAGINLKNQFIKDKSKKALEAYNAVKEHVNYLRILHNLPLMPEKSGIGGLTDTLQTFKEDVNNGNLSTALGTLNDKLSDIKSASKEFKEKFEGVYGNALSVANQVGNKIINTNDDLKRVGINVVKNDDISNAVENVQNLHPKNIAPKTIGDMIEAIKNKTNGLGGVIR
jgi:hypothetical protein